METVVVWLLTPILYLLSRALFRWLSVSRTYRLVSSAFGIILLVELVVVAYVRRGPVFSVVHGLALGALMFSAARIGGAVVFVIFSWMYRAFDYVFFDIIMRKPELKEKFTRRRRR